MISFSRFWFTLKLCDMSTYSLIKDYHISGSTINRLRHDKPISTLRLTGSAKFFAVMWTRLWSTHTILNEHSARLSGGCGRNSRGFRGLLSPDAYGFVNRRLTKQVMRYTYSAKA